MATVRNVRRLVNQSPEIQVGLHIHHLDALDPKIHTFAAEIARRSVRADLGWAAASLPILWYFEPAAMMNITSPAAEERDEALVGAEKEQVVSNRES